MKAIYQKPETTIILVQSQSLLQTGSKTPIGEGYKQGDAVLSRGNSSKNFSVWGDDEEEE